MGVAFVVAVVLLIAAAFGAALRPGDRRIGLATAALFAGLICAYVLSRTTGIPLLSTDTEPVDAVGVATNVVQALGFAFAALLVLLRRNPSRRRLTFQEVSQ
jgi:hypothetical protein